MTPSNIVLIKSLANYLTKEMGVPVLDGWPDAKKALELPSMTILWAGPITYTHQLPQQHLVTEIEGSTIEVLEVGFHDGRLQIDIWAEYPAQRDDLFQKLNKAINKNAYELEGPMGLSLTLDDYHNAIARVDQVGYSNLDGGDSSQRAEWRMKVDCLVNFPELIERNVSKIKELTIETEISESAVVVEETLEIF